MLPWLRHLDHPVLLIAASDNTMTVALLLRLNNSHRQHCASDTVSLRCGQPAEKVLVLYRGLSSPRASAVTLLVGSVQQGNGDNAQSNCHDHVRTMPRQRIAHRLGCAYFLPSAPTANDANISSLRSQVVRK